MHDLDPGDARVPTTLDADAAPATRGKTPLFHDPRSVQLLAQAERVARTDATVLIIGETGTGKELVARRIHAGSARKGPFVAVNCGAFNESIIDAELFGHESGAFTGAQHARSGWFEAANGGTLFLDEIGDLPLPLQVKLLRVLQERQVVRLGSRRPIALDVRLIAATNVELGAAVQAQRFRADLYYRLNVAPITLPPLRERPGDILPLAQHFIDLYAPGMGRRQVAIAPDAQAQLLAYTWPGNVRELENVIHFGLIVCQRDALRAEHLKLLGVAAREPEGGQRAAPLHLPAPPPDSPAGDDPLVSLQAAIEKLFDSGNAMPFSTVEEALVRTAYHRARGNQVQTARALGVTRNTLRTLLKRFGVLAGPSRPPDAPGFVQDHAARPAVRH